MFYTGPLLASLKEVDGH